MEWQPIETAPTDGKDILVCDCSVDGGHVTVVSWDDDGSGRPWLSQELIGYRADFFTHWMPLPEPPKP